MTASDLIEMLRTLPPNAREVVDGFESGFDDLSGATLQPIIVNDGHRERMIFGTVTFTPVDVGGGEHEHPKALDKPPAPDAAIEQAVYLTTRRSHLQLWDTN